MRLFLITMTFALYTFVFAQEAIDVSAQTSVTVQCPIADVSYVHAQTKSISVQSQIIEGNKARGQGWSFKVDKTTPNVVISCEPPESIMEKIGNQRYSIQLKGPSVPLNIFIRFGSVDINGIENPTHVTVERGSIKYLNTSQSAKLHIVSGSVDVEKHTGRLKIDAFDSKTKISNVDGNTDINHFSGILNAKNVNGEMTLNGKKSQIVLESISGGMRFDLDAGRLDIESFSGTLEGITDQTQFQAKLLNPVRFKVKSKAAQMKILVPNSSGAQVYFALTDGQFSVPSFLSQDTSGSVKVVKGTLRGGESGRVQVTGETGRVQLSTY